MIYLGIIFFLEYTPYFIQHEKKKDHMNAWH